MKGKKVAKKKYNPSYEKFGFNSYQDFLVSPIWEAFTKIVRKKSNYTCKACGVNEHTPDMISNVHHLKYDELLSIDNVILLCQNCHTELHENFDKITSKKIDLEQFTNDFVAKKIPSLHSMGEAIGTLARYIDLIPMRGVQQQINLDELYSNIMDDLCTPKKDISDKYAELILAKICLFTRFVEDYPESGCKFHVTWDYD